MVMADWKRKNYVMVRIAIATEAFHKKSLFCSSMNLETIERLVKCYVRNAAWLRNVDFGKERGRQNRRFLDVDMENSEEIKIL